MKIKDILKSKSFKDIIWMVVSNILVKPIQLVKSFYVAKYLGPEEYGILKSVELVQMLNKFGDLGFNSTVIREAGTMKGKKDIEGKNKNDIISLKNNAYSAELILSIILFLIGCSMSLFFENLIVKYSIIFSSIGLLSLKIFNLFHCELVLNRKFKLSGKIIIFQAIFNSVFIILLVPQFKIYSVLLIPIISTIIAIIIMLLNFGIPFNFGIKYYKLKKIFYTSIKLTIGTLSFGVFRYTERIIIISVLGLEAVGYFGFADTILSLLVTIFLMNIKVRKMNILEYLGQKEYVKVNNIVIRETVFLFFASLLTIIISIYLINWLIPIYLLKWKSAIIITQVLLLVLPLKVMSSYIVVVIKSPIVDKLFISPILHLCATFFLLITSYILYVNNLFTLKNFIIIDIIAYSIAHLPYIYIYKKYFYNPLVISSVNK